MKRTIVASIAVVAVVVAGCSSSVPTASDEYQALEEEHVIVEGQLAEAQQQLSDAAEEIAALHTAAWDTEEVPNQVPEEVVAVIDAYTRAVNTYDTTAMSAVLADDFTFQSYGDINDDYVSYVDMHYESLGFKYHPTGDPVGVRSGNVFIVAEPGKVVWNGNNGLGGFNVNTLVNVDGEWKLQQTRWIGEPTA